MPHFTLQLSAQGPVLLAYVGVSAPRAQALQDAGQPVPTPVSVQALVDTGASCTCVDPAVLSQLGLTPTGSVPINTPSTGTQPHHAEQYDVGLVIPGATTSAVPLRRPTLSVVASQLHAAQGIQALIGRDLLESCVLIYNGSVGFFTLSF